jgi:hypothetical protein
MYWKMDMAAPVHTLANFTAYWIKVLRTMSNSCTGSFGEEIMATVRR